MTKILNWIKANWLIVAMSALMVVVLPAVVIVSGGMNKSAQEEIQSRVQNVERDLKKVERTSVEIKPLIPGAPAFDSSVTVNQTVLNDYTTVREAIKSDADEIVAQALRINQKTRYLVPNLLPAPPSHRKDDLPFKIYDSMVKAHETMLSTLDAGMSPDPVDLYTQLEDFERNYRRTQLNADPSESLDKTEQEQLTKALTLQRVAAYHNAANEHAIYADLFAFNLPMWDKAQGKPSEIDWYDWQQITWIHEDIVQAIDEANGDVQVYDAVVKRIANILVEPVFSRRRTASNRGRGEVVEEEYFGNPEGGPEGGNPEGGFRGRGPEGGRATSGRGGSRGRQQEEPVAEANVSDPTAPLAMDYSKSLTGRTSNGLYDIRKVTAELIVDAQRLPRFLDAISRVNFMTVLSCTINQVDPMMELDQGFYYGEEPVVRVTLEIETLWLREWTMALMPDPVKEQLGIAIDSDDEEGDDEEDR